MLAGLKVVNPSIMFLLMLVAPLELNFKIECLSTLIVTISFIVFTNNHMSGRQFGINFQKSLG